MSSDSFDSGKFKQAVNLVMAIMDNHKAGMTYDEIAAKYNIDRRLVKDTCYVTAYSLTANRMKQQEPVTMDEYRKLINTDYSELEKRILSKLNGDKK